MHFVFFQLLSFTLNKQFLYSRMYFNTLLKEDTFVSSCCWHSCVLVTCADRFWYNGIFLINTSDLSSFLCSFNVHSFLFVCFVFPDRVSLCLELILWIRLSWNSQRSSRLCLLSAEVKGVHHHSPANVHIFKAIFQS